MSEWMRRTEGEAVLTTVTALTAMGVVEGKEPPREDARQPIVLPGAALSGGTRIAVDTDPAVAKRLPEEFIRLGASTHRDFDALAEAIQAGIGRDTLVARPGGLTSKCDSCHASYRVTTEEEGS